jgi:hypothetical protein
MTISLTPRGWGHLLRPLHLRSRAGLTRRENRDPRGVWDCFLDEFQPLSHYRRFRRQNHPGDVTARARKTCDKSEVDRIAIAQ